MKREHKNIITSRWLRTFIFLLLAYFSQVYPFYHLHHSHEDGLLDFKVSSHPIEVEVEHSSDHHHDGDTPQTDDHQHTYDKHIDWNNVRIQKPKTLTIDDQYSSASISYTPTNNNFSYLKYENFLFIPHNYVSSIIIRGPPLVG